MSHRRMTRATIHSPIRRYNNGQKCFKYEYNNDNGPDTGLVFVFAESLEEAASAMMEYDSDVTEDDLSEIDPNGAFFRAWERHAEVYHVRRGELAGGVEYDSYRDYMYDRQLELAELRGEGD